MLLAESIKNIQDGNFSVRNAMLCNGLTPKKFLFAIHPEIEYLPRIIGVNERHGIAIFHVGSLAYA
jgi:hypothetical protein